MRPNSNRAERVLDFKMTDGYFYSLNGKCYYSTVFENYIEEHDLDMYYLSDLDVETLEKELETIPSLYH